MEKFNKENPSSFNDLDTGNDTITTRLAQLAQQTNAYTLFVFKMAEKTARSHRDMEYFLKLRDAHARGQKIEKRPDTFGKNSD